MTTKAVHIPALDGVRGLAILLVFATHYGGGRHFDSLALQIMGQFFAGGWVGVDLFFVLSGFLITGILIDSRDDPGYYRTFYGRRVLRIFPVFYLTLGVVFALSFIFGPAPRLDQYSFLAFLNNIVVVFDDNVGRIGPALTLAAFWSLAVEEQFYMFWPLILKRAASTSAIVRIAISLIVLALAFRLIVGIFSLSAAYNLLFARMDGLAAGALLAVLVRRRAPVPRASLLAGSMMAIGLLGFLTIGAVTGTLYWQSYPMATIGFDFAAVAAAGLIWSVLIPGHPARRLFGLAPLRFFGRYSYGLYIYHQIFQTQLYEYLQPQLFGAIHNKGLAAAAYFLICLALLTAWAVLSFELYELRFLRLKRLFPYARRERPAGAAIGEPRPVAA